MAMTVCPWHAELELLRCKSENVFRVGFRGEACRGADRDMGFRGEDYEVRRGAESTSRRGEDDKRYVYRQYREIFNQWLRNSQNS